MGRVVSRSLVLVMFCRFAGDDVVPDLARALIQRLLSFEENNLQIRPVKLWKWNICLTSGSSVTSTFQYVGSLSWQFEMSSMRVLAFCTLSSTASAALQRHLFTGSSASSMVWASEPYVLNGW